MAALPTGSKKFDSPVPTRYLAAMDFESQFEHRDDVVFERQCNGERDKSLGQTAWIRWCVRFAVIACMGSSLAVGQIISTFDTGRGNWTAEGDNAGPVTWVETGGNPGGHIEIDDQVIGGITYFVAPDRYLNDQSAAYGTTFTFDLRQSYSGAPDQFDAPDLILVGAGLTLVFDTTGNPVNNVWTTYTPRLMPTARWHLDTLAGAMPTEAEMRSVLGNLTALKIRAEFQTGADTGSLDNVELIPEPSTAWLSLSGLLTGLSLRRRSNPARVRS